MESFDVSTFCCDKKFYLHPRCPLCLKRSSKFHCESCVRKGDFTRSSTKGMVYCPDRFVDKKMKLIVNTKKKSDIDVSDKLKNVYHTQELKQQLKEKKEKIKLLKLAIEEAQKKCEKSKLEWGKLRKGNEKGKYDNERVVKKRCDKEMWLQRNQERLNKRGQYVDNILKTLSAEMSTQVKLLTDYIFTIKRCGGRSEHSQSDSESTVTQIEEAISTSYVDGNWVQVLSDDSYLIIESQLPQNGDYSTYGDISNIDEVPGMPSVHCVNSALTYTSQLVSILAYIFNVKLPQRLNYYEFCNDISINKLKYKVAKLNVNVMYLCLAQGMDSEIVHPVKTLENLYTLLDQKYCKYRETKDLCQERSMVDVLEEQLIADLNSLDDSDESDDGSDLCSSHVSNNDISPDWEAVPQGIPSEELFNVHRPAFQERSITGSFLSAVSAFGIWRESSK